MGLKGMVRLCHVGMIVETSILLQGSEADVIAYCDALFAVRLPIHDALREHALSWPCKFHPKSPGTYNP